jgi:Subtilisin-like serine proteases
MTPEDLNKIYSNDFADFLISYNGDLSVLEQYKNNAVNIINYFYAVAHLPVSIMTEDVISKMGYAAIPSLFGLTYEENKDSSGIFRIRSVPNFNLRGKDVLIGFIDTGIDYTNPIFQNADKTTRISSIWDQTIVNNELQNSVISYGTEYSRDQINEALKNDNPFQIVPSMDEIGHGTMVAGIAAGNEVPESGFYGVAPDSELLIVKLKPAKANLKAFFRIPEHAFCYQENDIIFGIQYLLNYAAKVNKPIAICVATDTSQYAHDGRGTTSNWLSFQAITPGIAIVTSVGNEGNSQRHYFGEIQKEIGYNLVELKVGPKESGFSMEIWGSTPNIYSIDILSPSGEYIPRVTLKLNESKEINFIFEQTILNIDNQIIESQSGDQLILLRFSLPSQGIWKFKIYGRGVYPMYFNIWLPMSDFITDDTYFLHSDPYTTLLSLSCASSPITVTAYDTQDDTIYTNAGRGYTRFNLVKPDIAAPGVNMTSPTLNHGYTQVSGSSAAAAYTAGIATMMLEWGIIKGNYKNMNTQDMKIFMIRGARRKAGIEYPNREWGYGILDIFRVFDSLKRSI